LEQQARIKISCHLISYLKTLYGPKEPISFHKRSDYNTFLIRKLGRPPSNFKLKKELKPEITILLPETCLKDLNANNHLSIKDEKDFRKIIARDFIADYHAYIDLQFSKGKTRKEATIMFMNLFNIREEELGFWALYRDYNRMLQKRRLIFSKPVI
jgi:hypothetical protein